MLRDMTKKSLTEQSKTISGLFVFLCFVLFFQRQVAEGEKDLNVTCANDV